MKRAALTQTVCSGNGVFESTLLHSPPKPKVHNCLCASKSAPTCCSPQQLLVFMAKLASGRACVQANLAHRKQRLTGGRPCRDGCLGTTGPAVKGNNSKSGSNWTRVRCDSSLAAITRCAIYTWSTNCFGVCTAYDDAPNRRLYASRTHACRAMSGSRRRPSSRARGLHDCSRPTEAVDDDMVTGRQGSASEGQNGTLLVCVKEPQVSAVPLGTAALIHEACPRLVNDETEVQTPAACLSGSRLWVMSRCPVRRRGLGTSDSDQLLTEGLGSWLPDSKALALSCAEAVVVEAHFATRSTLT